jgi:hypothetical protein
MHRVSTIHTKSNHINKNSIGEIKQIGVIKNKKYDGKIKFRRY